MRVAAITDIHANLPALEAVIADIDAAQPEEIWCLGDLVGYGADPDECTELARERCDLCLVGNHDLAVLGGIPVGSFSSAAADAVLWTREHSSRRTLDYLASLLPAAERSGIGIFHASPRDPIWEYVLSSEQAGECLELQEHRVSLIGHSHIALYFHEVVAAPGRTRFRLEAHGAQAPGGIELELAEGRWILNPGSVGQPRDSDPRAAWLELDIAESVARYHRVEYDIDRAASSILAASLPEHLSRRLYVGR